MAQLTVKIVRRSSVPSCHEQMLLRTVDEEDSANFPDSSKKGISVQTDHK